MLLQACVAIERSIGGNTTRVHSVKGFQATSKSETTKQSGADSCAVTAIASRKDGEACE
jgi:hypothetical protein